ncbi:MAG: crossover junction endodeoxyribonuclease RuvC [Candidatus Cloacimonadota bacterium]|nr:MAG: crossover junction endodeoxyribonuclease RuvC [Candidatus Cloacimonadota bacterium]
MRIIGVDPGLQRTGYAVVEKKENDFLIVTSGVLTTKKTSIGKRLLSIYNGLLNIIEEYSPALMAVETGFYSKNVDSLVKMSQVKGVLIVAASLKGLEVFEYSPATIKSSVVGRGGATKEQVKYMVEQIMKREIEGGFDISDAIAVAICHFHRA